MAFAAIEQSEDFGRRLKQTGARWRVRRVNRMSGLCSLMDSRQWKTDWQTA